MKIISGVVGGCGVFMMVCIRVRSAFTAWIRNSGKMRKLGDRMEIFSTLISVPGNTHHRNLNKSARRKVT